jgi:hypothetical protein
LGNIRNIGDFVARKKVDNLGEAVNKHDDSVTTVEFGQINNVSAEIDLQGPEGAWKRCKFVVGNMARWFTSRTQVASRDYGSTQPLHQDNALFLVTKTADAPRFASLRPESIVQFLKSWDTREARQRKISEIDLDSYAFFTRMHNLELEVHHTT